MTTVATGDVVLSAFQLGDDCNEDKLEVENNAEEAIRELRARGVCR